jgi:hypothetical protein
MLNMILLKIIIKSNKLNKLLKKEYDTKYNELKNEENKNL